jgi:hypothetical protein
VLPFPWWFLSYDNDQIKSASARGNEASPNKTSFVKSEPENKLDKSLVLGYVLVDDSIHSRGQED